MRALVIPAIVLVAVIMAMSIGIVQAMNDELEAEVEAKLKLEQNGNDVDVTVKAEGLVTAASYTVRAYVDSVTNCIKGPGHLLAAIGTATLDGDGNLEISGTIEDAVIDDVGSVSIRSTGPPPSNPPVVCFQNTTP